MLRGHAGSLELIRGIINPITRRHFTATSVRCSDDNDRKKVKGVFSWLKDIFQSEVRVEEARNSLDVQIKDTPKGYPRNFASNIQSYSSSEVVSVVEKIVDAKISSTTEIIGHFGWYPSPVSSNLVLIAHGLDTQFRGVANCYPRNTKPPIREPNMPEKQQRKDDKEKKKKKKKPVLRTDATPEEFPDIVTMEAGQGLRDNPDANFRYQWGIKIPEETSQVSKIVQSEYIWGQAANSVTDSAKALIVTMSTSDMDKSSKKAETTAQNPPSQPTEPTSAIDETTGIDKREPEKIGKKVSGTSKENQPNDEDYNIPMGTEFDAEISAWKDLVLKSKMPIETSNKHEFVPDTSSADYLSIRPEPPLPKLDVQAIPSTNEGVTKDDDEEDISKLLKANLKKLDGKRTSDVHKIDSKKLHTSQSSDLDRCSSTSKSRGLWTWSTMSGLPGLNVMSFSTSSKNRASAEKINETKGAEAALAGKPTSPEDVDLASVGKMEEAASPDQQQLLRNTKQYQTNQPDVDSEFGDSRIADSGIEMSLQSTQEEHDVDDSNMTMADKDSIAMEAEDRHQHPNSFTQFEDDFVPDYEAMSLEPTTQERSAKEEQKQDQSTDDDGYNENESPGNNVNNYVSEGEYIKVPGDPYPYSKQYFERWRMTKEEINIGSFVGETTKDVEPDEAPAGDARPRQIENLPPTRSISHDVHLRNQLSRGKDARNPIMTDNPTSLSNPHDSGDSSLSSSMHAIDGLDKPEDRRHEDDRPSSREGTIHPDSHHTLPGNNISKPNVSEARKRVKSKVANLILNNTSNEKRIIEENFHITRKKRLMSVSKKEIEEIYEHKNYAYLQPEEMKNLRFNVPRANDQGSRPTSDNQ